MAYFILTLFQKAAEEATSAEKAASAKEGARKRAARHFRIDEKVLGKIGELSSKRGDERTARTAHEPGEKFQELTSVEKQWLEEAIPRVILRLGEHAPSISLALISLGDLPRL